MDDTKLTRQQWETILTAICQEPSSVGDFHVKKLYIGRNNLSSIDLGLLANAACRLEEVDLCYTQLTGQQVEEVMTAIYERQSWLKDMNVSGIDLSALDHCLLARAVTWLLEVKMVDTQLTRQQVDRILTSISMEMSRIGKLYIHFNNISTVKPSLMARAVSRLEGVGLGGTQLIVEQAAVILTYISEDHSCLKKLNIS